MTRLSRLKVSTEQTEQQDAAATGIARDDRALETLGCGRLSLIPYPPHGCAYVSGLGLITDPIRDCAYAINKETISVSTALRELEEQYSAKLKFVEKIFQGSRPSPMAILIYARVKRFATWPMTMPPACACDEIEQELKDLFDRKSVAQRYGRSA